MARPKGSKNTVSKPQTDYVVALNVLGKNYHAQGATIAEALRKINVRGIRGKCILVVSHDGKTRERIITPIQAQRAFEARGMTQDIGIKNLSILFV